MARHASHERGDTLTFFRRHWCNGCCLLWSARGEINSERSKAFIHGIKWDKGARCEVGIVGESHPVRGREGPTETHLHRRTHVGNADEHAASIARQINAAWNESFLPFGTVEFEVRRAVVGRAFVVPALSRKPRRVSQWFRVQD